MHQYLQIELVILIASALLLLSILASKISDRFGIPSLLLFLLLGMLAGSEGPGGISFDDAWLAKLIGIVALNFILFSGGLETKLSDIRPIWAEGVSLATIGVLLTAFFVASFATYVLKFTFLEGMLLGAIVSSSDAAAVLNILRSNEIHLKNRLRSLLELESGSNDPMAVFLTLGTIRLMTDPHFTLQQLIPQCILEILVGVIMAVLLSRLFLFIINHLKFAYEGLYPVFTLAFVLLIYAITTMAKGNGFLSVYLTALIVGNKEFLYKKTLIRFHEGIAWLMQITMFLILGLLVFPSHMVPIIGAGFFVSVFLIVIARPCSVFIALVFSRIKINDKFMLSWVGLRGAVPIILATFPLLAHIPKSEIIFNIVFFIVLTSMFIQGTSIADVSRLLRVDIPMKRKHAFPIEFDRKEGMDADLEELIVPYHSLVVGKKIFELGAQEDCLIVLLCRDGKFFIPKGTTILEGGDVLQVLGKTSAMKALEQQLKGSA